MKMIPPILATIIILSIVGIALYYSKVKSNNISALALWIQAIATVVLVLITGFYALETYQSRISQEKGFKDYVNAMEDSTKAQKEGFNKYIEELQKSRLSQEEGVEKYIKELQESRKQEVKPQIYSLFEYSHNSSKFFLVIQNVGVGPAFDIEANYTTTNRDGKELKRTYKCPLLAPGKESVDSSSFDITSAKKVDSVLINITYKNSFGEVFSQTYEDRLLTKQPIPTNFSERSQKIHNQLYRDEINIWVTNLLQTLDGIKKELTEIKEKIKKP